MRAALVFFFAYTNILGRTETRTRDRMYLGRIRSVRYISRGDRARIATCSLRTPTDLRHIVDTVFMYLCWTRLDLFCRKSLYTCTNKVTHLFCSCLLRVVVVKCHVTTQVIVQYAFIAKTPLQPRASLVTLSGVMCNTSQCTLRSTFRNLGVTNVVFIVTY